MSNLNNEFLLKTISAASHDLHVPLRGITCFSRFLQSEYSDQLDETANHYVNEIIRNAERMSQLVTSLVEYGHAEAQELTIESTSLNEVIDELISLLDAEISDATGIVTRDELPVVLGNRKLLSKMFYNLLSNSLKFRSSSQTRVHFSASQDAMWNISVRDNGIGIHCKYHDQIFDVGRRLHSYREYPGNGIGLALCRCIARRHGGNINIDSTPDAGSTFVVTLPLSISQIG